MDPLSITASVLTLLTAANKVAKGLEKLASIRGAPAAVLALNNELSDLRLVLAEAEPLLQRHAHSAFFPATRGRTVQLSIDKAKGRLADLESIIGNRLMRRMGTRDRLGWLYEQDRVQKALTDVRTAKENVTAMLGVANASVISSIPSMNMSVSDAK